MGASGGVMVCELDEQFFTSQFESLWVLNSNDLV